MIDSSHEEKAESRNDVVLHLKALRAFALNLCGDRTLADDLVQETVLKAWTNMDKFEFGTNMRAWLFTILRNIYYSDRRKSRREVSDPDGEFSRRLSQKPDHDVHLAMRDFRRAIQRLPDEQREALLLIGAAGFSYAEAARTCGVAVGTIKSRASRARDNLTRILGMTEGESPLDDDPVATAVIGGHGARR